MYQKFQFVLFFGAALCAVSSANTYSYNPLTRQLVREEASCNKTGFQCDGCKVSAECIEAAEGIFFVNKNPCDPEFSCLESTGQCSKELNAKCDPNLNSYTMTCSQPGLFPHPFKRCEYMACNAKADGAVDPAPVPMKCSPGYAFDPYTSLCRDKLPDAAACPLLIPPCTNSSQRATIPGHPSMYYICLRNAASVLLPRLFLCPRDQVYSETKRACEEITRNTGLDKDKKCVAKGNYYVASSCQQYNECGGPGYTPALRTCPEKRRFNDKLSICQDITCSMLDPLKL